MTDLEKLIVLLREWDVPYQEDTGIFTLFSGETYPGRSVTVGGFDSPDSPNIGGYCGFYTTFLFTSEGKFSMIGAWE